jgi:hypothetical protein
VEYLTAVLPESERWVCVEIAVSESEPVKFWKRDILACIIKMYGNVKHGTGFTYSGDSFNAKREPHGTSVWLREEAHVRHTLGQHAFLAGVQLYADSTIVNLKGGSVHPVYVCLLNHTYAEKIKCIETVAYLPQLRSTPGVPPDLMRLNKLSLYHTSFDVLFKPLKYVLPTGVLMPGPDGVRRLVVPVVLNFIGDNPEV